MKIVSVKQPWASAAVFGQIEVLNLNAQTRYRGLVLVRAAGFDRRAPTTRGQVAPALRTPYSHVYNAVIGAVTVDHTATAGDCQLPFAVGPAVWVVGDPQVFPEPIHCPGFIRSADVSRRELGFVDVDDDDMHQALKNAIAPRDFARLTQHHDHGVTPDQVYPRRADGWVGD